MTCHYIIIHPLIQTEWDQYGIDWEGPAAVGEDDTVVVDDLGLTLTDLDAAELDEELHHVDGSSVDVHEMISKYIVARTFIHNNAMQLTQQ